MKKVVLVYMKKDGKTVDRRERIGIPEPLYRTAVRAGETNTAMTFDADDDSNGTQYTLVRVNLDEDPPELHLIPVEGGTPIKTH
jgi:hypothetical protein